MDGLPSIAERKKQLGVCDDGTNSASVAKLLGRVISDPQNSRHSRSAPSSPKSKTFFKKSAPKSTPLKRKMAEKPPVAPKPPFLKKSPPARKPRRLPPSKPLPYLQHKEIKEKQITTFRPAQPMSSRPLPPVPTQKPTRRISEKGEPSPEFFQPKQTATTVEYEIPEIPKKPLMKPEPIIQRPRMDTPLDLEKVISNGMSSPGFDSKLSPRSVPAKPKTEVTSSSDGGALFTQAYAHIEQEDETEDGMYAVIKESPRRMPRSPPPASIESVKLNTEVNPSIQVPSPALPEADYNVTSHTTAAKAQKSPPPPDEYSLLDRPYKKDGGVHVVEGYSALDILDNPVSETSQTGLDHVQHEGYSHLEFSEDSNQPADLEPADEASYAEIPSTPEAVRKKAKLEPTKPVEAPRPPKTSARRASLKSKEQSLQVSRDRSKLPAYQAEKATSQSSPPPKPKRLRSQPPAIESHSQSSTMESHSHTAGKPPLDAIPIPSQVEESALEEAGYETWNTFSPPPESEQPTPSWEWERGEEMRMQVEEEETRSVQHDISPKFEVDIDYFVQMSTTAGSKPKPHTPASEAPEGDSGVKHLEPPLATRKSSGYENQEIIDAVQGSGATAKEASHSLVGSYVNQEIIEAVHRSSSITNQREDIGPVLAVIPSSPLAVFQTEATIMDPLGYCEVDVESPRHLVSSVPDPKKPVPAPRRDRQDSTNSGMISPTSPHNESHKIEEMEAVSTEVFQAQSPNMDALGYYELDIESPTHLAAAPGPKKPILVPHGSGTNSSTVSTTAQKDTSFQKGSPGIGEMEAVSEAFQSPNMDALGYCELDVESPRHLAGPKKPILVPLGSGANSSTVSTTAHKDALPQKGSPGIGEMEAVSTKDQNSQPIPGEEAACEDVYVTKEMIMARKEQSKREKAFSKGEKEKETTSKETSEKRAPVKKSHGLPRRRPPPPPPINIPKIQASGSSTLPRASPRKAEFPKPKDKSNAISRAKSKSVRAAKPKSKGNNAASKDDGELGRSLPLSPARDQSPRPDPSESPSLGKRLKGLFKGPTYPDGKKSFRKKEPMEEMPSLSPSAKTLSLPASARRNGDIDASDEFGIYSTIAECAPKSPQSANIQLDSSAYVLVDTDTKGKSKVPGPKVPGPKVPGPKVAWPKVPGPKVPGPKVSGPKVAGPKKGKKGFTMRKSQSIEHLYDSADVSKSSKPHLPVTPPRAPRSASNSPVVRRRQPPRPPPDHPLPYHLATLPRRKPGRDTANSDFSHLYATVIQPPKTKAKPKAKTKKTAVESQQPLRVAEPSSELSTAELPLPPSDSSKDDHTPELIQDEEEPGLLSSEIPHTLSGEGQQYAVIDIKTKKKKGLNKGLASEAAPSDEAQERMEQGGQSPREKEPKEEGQQNQQTDDKTQPQATDLLPTRPPKPPRSRAAPPKPPPSYRESYRGDIPPRSPNNKSPQAPPTPPQSPSTPPSQRRSEQTTSKTNGKVQVARLSDIGPPCPPSFPPPPPPRSPTPEADRKLSTNVQKRGLLGPTLHVPPSPPTSDEKFIVEHTYDIPALEVSRHSLDSQHNRSAPVAQIKSGSETKPQSDAPQPEAREGIYDPVPDEDVPFEEGQGLISTSLVLVDESQERAPVPKTGHLYEVVPDDVLQGPKSVNVPLKRQLHVYDVVPANFTKPRGQLRRYPQLKPRSKPPPAPPVAKKPARTGMSSLSPHAPVLRYSSVPLEDLDSPVSDPGSLPADSRVVKRRDRDTAKSRGGRGGGGGGGGIGLGIGIGEFGGPQFLFPKSHSQSFIEVGHDGPSPGPGATPSPSLSSSTLNEDDSDAYSTEWETSSVEEEEERKKERVPKTKTFYIAQEILTTERTFVKGLTLLHKDFRQTVLSANRAHEKPVIAEETLRQILGAVGSLLTLNSGLLQELEERMANWDEDPRIGDILLNRAPYLKLYTEYISKFDKALKALDDAMRKSPLFAEVVHEFEARPKCAKLTVASYMLETVQRIPRYKLLLAEYIKHLPEDSPDRKPSENAHKIISSVATHVNETIRQMDNFKKVVEVQKRLTGDTGDSLITPYRKLVKEGVLMKFSRKEKQPRMFFLFTDLLIYASSVPPANTTYKVIKRIPLDGMRVEALDDPEMRHGFQIISTCKSFRLEGSSAEERQEWLQAFEMVIREHTESVESRERVRRSYDVGSEESASVPLGQLAPPWLPDSAVSMCQLCSVHFTVTRRRHHCRACGMIFCADCSNYYAALKYKGNKLGRVCQACCGKLCMVTGDEEDKSPKRRNRSSRKMVMPSVLREVRARDQNAQISGYIMAHTSKTKRWKKRWFVVYNLVLYEFERHEDVTAKSSIPLPSYQVISPVPRHDDPLVFCLRHPGLTKWYFKVDSEEQLQRWLEILQKAVQGEIEGKGSLPKTTAAQKTDSTGDTESADSVERPDADII